MHRDALNQRFPRPLCNLSSPSPPTVQKEGRALQRAHPHIKLEFHVQRHLEHSRQVGAGKAIAVGTGNHGIAARITLGD